MLNEILGAVVQRDRERQIEAAIRRRRLIDSGGSVKAQRPVETTESEPRRGNRRLPAAL